MVGDMEIGKLQSSIGGARSRADFLFARYPTTATPLAVTSLPGSNPEPRRLGTFRLSLHSLSLRSPEEHSEHGTRSLPSAVQAATGGVVAMPPCVAVIWMVNPVPMGACLRKAANASLFMIR